MSDVVTYRTTDNGDVIEGSPHPGLFMSREIDKLAAALAKAQGQIRSAAKDSVNPHFKSKYADLASIDEASKEALSKHGLAVVQLPRAQGRQVTLIYALLHESGQYMGSDLTMTAQQDTPQAIGGCITYERRYTKAALVGISQDDDDGQTASHPPAPQQRPVQTKPTPPTQLFSDTLYDEEKPALKNALLNVAKKHGISKVDDLRSLSKSCMGIEMGSLDAAVSEWLAKNRPRA